MSTDPSDILEKLRQGFIKRLNSRADAIEAAADSTCLDIPEIQRLAHSLKGAALQFGYEDLSASAKSLEILAGSLGCDTAKEDCHTLVSVKIKAKTFELIKEIRKLASS